MTLSTLTPRLVSNKCLSRILCMRFASGKGMKLEVRKMYTSLFFISSKSPVLPSRTYIENWLQGKQSLTMDPKLGFFKYERDISRDKRYENPQKLGDTPMRWASLVSFNAVQKEMTLNGCWWRAFTEHWPYWGQGPIQCGFLLLILKLCDTTSVLPIYKKSDTQTWQINS